MADEVFGEQLVSKRRNTKWAEEEEAEWEEAEDGAEEDRAAGKVRGQADRVEDEWAVHSRVALSASVFARIADIKNRMNGEYPACRSSARSAELS